CWIMFNRIGGTVHILHGMSYSMRRMRRQFFGAPGEEGLFNRLVRLSNDIEPNLYPAPEALKERLRETFDTLKSIEAVMGYEIPLYVRRIFLSRTLALIFFTVLFM